MMNIIRADIYAILRGKAIYITFAALILLHVLVIGTQGVGGINFVGIEGGDNFELPDVGFDGFRSAALLYTRTDNIIFFLLPLIILATAPIFTFGTVKNDISWGVCRTKLYLSKLIVSLGLCTLLMLFYMGAGMLFATALNGFGGPVPDNYWLNLFQTVGSQLFMLFAATCFGVFLVFVTKKTSAATSLYIGIILVPSFIVMMLLEAGINATWVLNFDLMMAINRLGFFSQLETYAIIRTLLAGAAYILATTIGGIFLFKRAEIK